MKRVQFYNGFKAIFEGSIAKELITREGVRHFEMVDVKFIKPSDINFDGANTLNTTTVLEANIL